MRNLQRGKRIALALAWTGMLFCTSVQAMDSFIIHLANGDRLTGTIVSENATNLLLDAGLLGKVSVPVSQISKREPLNPPASLPAPKTPPSSTGPVATNTAASTLANPIPANVSQVPVTPADAPKPPRPKEWNTELQLGMNLRYSTADASEYLAALKSTYAHDKVRQTFDYNFTYGKTEQIISANRMIGSSKTDLDLSKRIYLYNLGGAGYDEVQKIDLQYEIGPGFGINILTRTNFIWKSELGFSFQDKFQSDQTENITYSARLGELVTITLWNKIVADAKIEYFSNLQSVGDYRLRIEGVLRYPILKNLSINLNVIDLYDTLPAPGVEKNDLQIRSALGLKF
jgi:hypothetical protein